MALDRSSASIILDDARRIISNSVILHSLLDDYGLTRSEIRLADNRRWIIKSADRCNDSCPHAEATEGPHVCLHRDRCLHLAASSGVHSSLIMLAPPARSQPIHDQPR